VRTVLIASRKREHPVVPCAAAFGSRVHAIINVPPVEFLVHVE